MDQKPIEIDSDSLGCGGGGKEDINQPWDGWLFGELWVVV